MKNTLATIEIIVLVAAAIVFGLTALTVVQLKAQEYRIQEAEQMVDRLAKRFARVTAACGQAITREKAKDCRQKATDLFDDLPKQIRETAANGDWSQWENIVLIVKYVETSSEESLQGIE